MQHVSFKYTSVIYLNSLIMFTFGWNLIKNDIWLRIQKLRLLSIIFPFLVDRYLISEKESTLYFRALIVNTLDSATSYMICHGIHILLQCNSPLLMVSLVHAIPCISLRHMWDRSISVGLQVYFSSMKMPTLQLSLIYSFPSWDFKNSFSFGLLWSLWKALKQNW